jgi:hypothetical protein
MSLPVVTVPSGGLPVVNVTATPPMRGLPVSESPNGRGIPVTQVAAGKAALAVVFTPVAGPFSEGG